MTDYINRQAAIDAVMELMPSLTTADGTGQFDAEIYRAQELFVDIGQVLNDLPSVEVEPVKHGRWKPFDLTWGRSVYACTSCGEAFEVPTEMGKPIFIYCPYCGAKMEEME